MNVLVEALAPAFVVSLALQQLLELLDPVLDRWFKSQKSLLMSGVAMGVSLLLSVLLDIRLLRALEVQTLGILDVVVTALFLTGGTKGINDLLKVVDYRKEALHAAAGNGEAAALD